MLEPYKKSVLKNNGRGLGTVTVPSGGLGAAPPRKARNDSQSWYFSSILRNVFIINVCTVSLLIPSILMPSILMPSMLMAADRWYDHDGLIEAEPARPGQILLAQKIHLDRKKLKAEGELILRSLRPLTGTLHFKKSRGDLRQFLAKMIDRFYGKNNSVSRVIRQLEIEDLSLEDFSITITEKGYILKLGSAVIPEGHLRDVTGWLDHEGHWSVSSGALVLTKIPLRIKPPLEPIPLSYHRLKASGDVEAGFSLYLEKINIAKLPKQSDPSGFFGPVLQAMGFDQGVQSTPLRFDQFETTVVAEKNQLVTESLLLSTSAASLTGKVYMPWKPKPRQMHMDLVVDAKKKSVKRFQAVMPLVLQ